MEKKYNKHVKKNYKPIIAVLAAVAAAAVLFAVKTAMKYDSDIHITEQSVRRNTEPEETAASEPTPEPISRRGTAQPIPDDIRASMQGKSMKDGASVKYEDLSYLTVPYYDFNYDISTGHMVVDANLAEEVLDIFAELFDVKYPIERMELIDKYDADDFTSIEYNNTSAFNYRPVSTGTGKLSNHAFGRAVDINPQQNPYVYSSGKGAHENAREFWERDVAKWTRDIDRAAFIGNDTEIYRIFKKYGWTWGGDWSSAKDYQHFEK